MKAATHVTGCCKFCRTTHPCGSGSPRMTQWILGSDHWISANATCDGLQPKSKLLYSIERITLTAVDWGISWSKPITFPVISNIEYIVAHQFHGRSPVHWTCSLRHVAWAWPTKNSPSSSACFCFTSPLDESKMYQNYSLWNLPPTDVVWMVYTLSTPIIQA